MTSRRRPPFRRSPRRSANWNVLRHSGALGPSRSRFQDSTIKLITTYKRLTTALVGYIALSSTSSDVHVLQFQESGDTGRNPSHPNMNLGPRANLIALGPRSPPHLPIVTRRDGNSRGCLASNEVRRPRRDRGVAPRCCRHPRDRPALKTSPSWDRSATNRIRRPFRELRLYRNRMAFWRPESGPAGLPCHDGHHIRASSRGTVDQRSN